MKRRWLIALALTPLALLLSAIGYCWHPRIWRVPEVDGRVVYFREETLPDGLAVAAGDPVPAVVVLVHMKRETATTNMGGGSPTLENSVEWDCGYTITDDNGRFHIPARMGVYMHLRFLLTYTNLTGPRLVLLAPNSNLEVEGEGDRPEFATFLGSDIEECSAEEIVNRIRISRIAPLHPNDRERLNLIASGEIIPGVAASPPPPPPPKMETVQAPPRIIPELGMELLPISAGEFRMGSAEVFAAPIHKVTITYMYWMGKTEVTQTQWQAIMDNNPSEFQIDNENNPDVFQGDNRPVEMVSWNDCVEFCQKLTEHERAADRLPDGYVYRLPTEAEWEFAARGGSRSGGFTYSGSNKLDEVAWCGSNFNDGGATQPVGQLRPNELGLYDMIGNVWEWCHDRFEKYPAAHVTDPPGPDRGFGGFDDRIMRGGSWCSYVEACTPSYRSSWKPEGPEYDVGLRVVLAPPIPADQLSK
jgi:formylglycine-generating enzyme required for sulfatase activity